MLPLVAVKGGSRIVNQQIVHELRAPREAGDTGGLRAKERIAQSPYQHALRLRARAVWMGEDLSEVYAAPDARCSAAFDRIDPEFQRLLAAYRRTG